MITRLIRCTMSAFISDWGQPWRSHNVWLINMTRLVFPNVLRSWFCRNSIGSSLLHHLSQLIPIMTSSLLPLVQYACVHNFMHIHSNNNYIFQLIAICTFLVLLQLQDCLYLNNSKVRSPSCLRNWPLPFYNIYMICAVMKFWAMKMAVNFLEFPLQLRWFL